MTETHQQRAMSNKHGLLAFLAASYARLALLAPTPPTQGSVRLLLEAKTSSMVPSDGEKGQRAGAVAALPVLMRSFSNSSSSSDLA